MAENKRTFKQLSKEKTYAELMDFSKKITELYANSDSIYSQSKISEENNVTIKCLRDLMDYAIVMSLVSKPICDRVLEKAVCNQRNKIQESGWNSILHHKELIKRREELLINSFFEPEIYRIANDVAENFDYSIHQFTIKYNIESDKITRKLLERAITENIVSDNVVEKLIERSLKDITDMVELSRATKYFDYIVGKRNKKKT